MFYLLVYKVILNDYVVLIELHYYNMQYYIMFTQTKRFTFLLKALSDYSRQQTRKLPYVLLSHYTG